MEGLWPLDHSHLGLRTKSFDEFRKAKYIVLCRLGKVLCRILCKSGMLEEQKVSYDTEIYV